MAKAKVGDWYLFRGSNGGYMIDHITMVDAEKDIVWGSRYCALVNPDSNFIDYSANIGGTEDKEDYEESLDRFFVKISAEEAYKKFLAEPLPENVRQHFLMEEQLEIK